MPKSTTKAFFSYNFIAAGNCRRFEFCRGKRMMKSEHISSFFHGGKGRYFSKALANKPSLIYTNNATEYNSYDGRGRVRKGVKFFCGTEGIRKGKRSFYPKISGKANHALTKLWKAFAPTEQPFFRKENLSGKPTEQNTAMCVLLIFLR